MVSTHSSHQLKHSSLKSQSSSRRHQGLSHRRRARVHCLGRQRQGASHQQLSQDASRCPRRRLKQKMYPAQVPSKKAPGVECFGGLDIPVKVTVFKESLQRDNQALYIFCMLELGEFSCNLPPPRNCDHRLMSGCA